MKRSARLRLTRHINSVSPRGPGPAKTWIYCQFSTKIMTQVQNIDSKITRETAEHLRLNGFAIVDGFLGEELCDALRKEIRTGEEERLLHPNATHLVTAGKYGSKQADFIDKKGVREMEITNEETRMRFSNFASLHQDHTFLNHMASYFPELKLNRQALKGQFNEGNGACFPMHPDSDTGIDRRQISSIVYLNNKWKPGDGGELRLYPFPYAHVDVEPRNDRLVMFSSANFIHRVLPTHAERICFTMWLSGDGDRNLDQKTLPTVSDGEYPWELLLTARYRKQLARVVYASEWAKSLEESHPSGPLRDKLIADHWAMVQRVMIAFGDSMPLVAQYLPIVDRTNLPPRFRPETIDWF